MGALHYGNNSNETDVEVTTVDPEYQYTPYGQRPETYIVPVLFLIIFVVGVVGNGTLVIVFLRHRAMRTVPNTYIFSLALGDLLVIITCVPFTSIIYTVESWPWGRLVCKISETTKNISIGVSVFTLTALSVERYYAVVNPLKRLQAKHLTIFSAIMIWILAAFFAIPDAYFAHDIALDIASEKTIRICIPYPNITRTTYTKYNVVLKALVYYLIPLAAITFFYVLMAIRLQLSVSEMPGESAGPQNTAQARSRRHIARMVLVFVFLFFICFLPHHIYMLWFHLNPESEAEFDDYWHALRIMAFCLSFLNSCVNPVALYCVSGVFRTHFNRYLCCRRITLTNNTSSTRTTYSSRKFTQETSVDGSIQQTFKKKNLALCNSNQSETNQTCSTSNIDCSFATKIESLSL